MGKPCKQQPLVRIGILAAQQSEEAAEAIHNMNKKFVEDKSKKSLVEEVLVDDKGTTKTCAVKGWRTKKQIQAYKAAYGVRTNGTTEYEDDADRDANEEPVPEVQASPALAALIKRGVDKVKK